MKDLKTLLKEVDKLFPKRFGSFTYNYILAKGVEGWTFEVVCNWYNWSDMNMKHEFGIYSEPESTLQAFLDYVKEHKINVAELTKD